MNKQKFFKLITSLIVFFVLIILIKINKQYSYQLQAAPIETYNMMQNAKIPQKDKIQIGYIEIYLRNGKTFLDIDPVKWYEGEKAIETAMDYTKCSRESVFNSDCAPSLNFGYYILKNKKSKKYTYTISQKAVINGIFFIKADKIRTKINKLCQIEIDGNQVIKIERKKGKDKPIREFKEIILAKQTLEQFLNLLKDGDYNKAAELLSYGEIQKFEKYLVNEKIIDKTPVIKNYYNLLGSYTKANILEESAIEPDEFDFVVQFIKKDGKFLMVTPLKEAKESTTSEFDFKVIKIKDKYFVVTPYISI